MLCSHLYYAQHPFPTPLVPNLSILYHTTTKQFTSEISSWGKCGCSRHIKALWFSLRKTGLANSMTLLLNSYSRAWIEKRLHMEEPALALSH